MVAAQAPVARRGETLKESSKEKDVRISNIVAAKGAFDGRGNVGWMGRPQMF